LSQMATLRPNTEFLDCLGIPAVRLPKQLEQRSCLQTAIALDAPGGKLISTRDSRHKHPRDAHKAVRGGNSALEVAMAPCPRSLQKGYVM
jgi:hypothetical protein